jgi:hypothetical protein
MKPGKVLFTRDGRKVIFTGKLGNYLKGTIGKRNFTWQYTGNYIGSNYPHGLDINWKRKE